MVLQRIRRAAAVLALAATLALAAPAHAVGWKDFAAGSGWFEEALKWIAQFGVGGGETRGLKPATPKACAAIDPNGCPSAPAPSPSSNTGDHDPDS